MHANRNKKAVKRVEKGMMKANRIRNLFAVFAIVLTTFMITTVFSLGINYMENMKLMQVRTAGTTANASLAMPTEKQEQQIKNLEYVKTVGTQYMVGSVAEKNDEGRDLSIALVFMSLFMGITMILGVNGVISSMSAENFIKEYMDYNFEYTDIQFEQYEQLNKEVPQFDEHFVEQIKQLDGIKNIDVQKTVWAGIDFNENDLEGFMKIKYEDSKYKAKGQSYEQTIETLKGYAESGDYGCYITTLPDDRVLEEYNAEHPDTPIDMEAFKRGETAIAGKDTEYNAPNTALVGETLTLTADSTDGKATDFKIGGAFYYDDYDNTLSEGIGRRKEINMVPDVIFVSEAGMERLTKEPIISAIGVDIKNFNDLERIDSELQAINSTLTTSEWQLKSSVNQKELYNQMNYSLSLLGNGAAILLIVIGLINFVNVMLTGVVARKNEFAIMESIGTTKKQIRKILTLEGGIYALISTLLIMTFGNAFLMLVADAVPHMANYAVFKYPVALVIGLIAAIFVICLSVPAIVYKASGGVVDLKITEYPSYLRLDVSDNGIGIPEEEQAKIFGRFYRGKQSAGVDGVGIGLYLTRDIVNKQNGYIKVASDEKGTIFSLFLKKV